MPINVTLSPTKYNYNCTKFSNNSLSIPFEYSFFLVLNIQQGQYAYLLIHNEAQKLNIKSSMLPHLRKKATFNCIIFIIIKVTGHSIFFFFFFFGFPPSVQDFLFKCFVNFFLCRKKVFCCLMVQGDSPPPSYWFKPLKNTNCFCVSSLMTFKIR